MQDRWTVRTVFALAQITEIKKASQIRCEKRLAVSAASPIENRPEFVLAQRRSSDAKRDWHRVFHLMGGCHVNDRSRALSGSRPAYRQGYRVTRQTPSAHGAA